MKEFLQHESVTLGSNTLSMYRLAALGMVVGITWGIS